MKRFGIAAAIAIGIAISVWIISTRGYFDLASGNVRHTWRPVVSLPWVDYGFDFGGVTGGIRGVSSDRRIDAWLERLEQNGIQAVTWFLFADGRGSLVFDPSGYVLGVAPEFLADYRSVLKLARKHHLKVIWILTDFELGMPPRTAGGLHMFGHADLIEEEAKRQSFIRNALAPVLRDGDDAGQIAGWIAINEPEQLLRSGRVTETAVRAFVEETASAIKRARRHQRVGLANASLASMIQFADIAGLDFLDFHHYGAGLPPPAAFVRDYIREHFKIADARPIFIGEFNLNYPPSLDLDRFVRTARAFGYAGVWPWSLRDRVNESGTQATETEPQFAQIGAYARSVQSAPGLPGDWASSLLPTVEQRISQLQGQPEHHRAEAVNNLEWAERSRAELARAEQKLDAESLEKQRDNWSIAARRSRMHSYLQRETALELDWLRTLERRLTNLNPPASGATAHKGAGPLPAR